MPRKLKVFRTAIGFHDAYVAASSRKAALAAWGSDKDLFSRGMAEEVTDDALAAPALATPGTVIRQSRGTAAEQMAALPEGPAARKKPAASETKRMQPAVRRPPKLRPRPDRKPLEKAERALTVAVRQQEGAMAEIKAKEAALARERRALERTHRDEITRLARARDREAAQLAQAMQTWRAARD